MHKLLINPFFIYALSFSYSLFLYELKWSELYQELSGDLLLFLYLTIIISIFLSFLFNPLIKEGKESINISKKNSYFICFFITLGFISEYVYSKQVPLLSVLFGLSLDYKEFGIPTFHVFLIPYASVFSILSFYRFIESKKDKYNIYSFFYMVILISSIMNRGALVIIFATVGLIVFYKNFSFKYLIILSFISGVFLYGFGVLGNKRMISSGYQDEWAILSVGEATDEFQNSWIPNEFFWGYLYSSVSIANLNNQVDSKPNGNFGDVVFLDMLPDFVSKRLYTDDDILRFTPRLLRDELTTSTIYGRSINILGINGAIFIYLWLIVFCFFSIGFSLNKYRIPVLSILSITSGLSIFSNMFVFSGTILQIIFVVLLVRFKFYGNNLL